MIRSIIYIGSGFGYPNFLASFMSGCKGIGIETESVRVSTCNTIKDAIRKEEAFNTTDWVDRVSFYECNATFDEDKPFTNNDGQHVSHIYSYNII